MKEDKRLSGDPESRIFTDSWKIDAQAGFNSKQYLMSTYYELDTIVGSKQDGADGFQGWPRDSSCLKTALGSTATALSSQNKNLH